MALTMAHIALIDILTDRLITATMGIKRVRQMSEQEVIEEIEKVDADRAEEIRRLLAH